MFFFVRRARDMLLLKNPFSFYPLVMAQEIGYMP
jgi:hypothetical protein